MRYKRNQVEEAVVRTLGAEGARVDELKLKMKRLLVTDRRLGRGKRADDKADHRYAFYSQRPQGSGVEVMFTGYEAFALLAASSCSNMASHKPRSSAYCRKSARSLRPPIAILCRKIQRSCSIRSWFDQWHARACSRSTIQRRCFWHL
jgi:hypothetical protein